VTKKYFLCGECEKRFEGYETPFASQVFTPLHGEVGQVPAQIEYGPWALKFAVSVTWRLLKHYSEKPGFSQVPVVPRERLLAALRTWRCFLLEYRSEPAEFEIHLLPFGPIETPVPGMSPFFNRYVERSIDDTLVDNGQEALVYAKLGRVILFGVIPRGSRPREWKRATRLAVKRGAIGTKGSVYLPGGIAEFLSAQSDRAAALMSGMSPRQEQLAKNRLDRNIRDNPDAPVLRAYLRDYELFWPRCAVGRGRRGERRRLTRRWNVEVGVRSEVGSDEIRLTGEGPRGSGFCFSVFPLNVESAVVTPKL
jgi:hypothetical protein